MEDHVGVCSNGYGAPVTSKDLKSLLSSRLVRKYDIILVDCPVDCLKVIDEEIVSMCHVLIYCGGSKQDFIDMSLGLSNRDVVKLSVEKYIMRNCEVEVCGTLNGRDLAYMKDTCLFANGSWLEKVV